MKLIKNDRRTAMGRAAALILSLGLITLGCSVEGGTEAASSTSQALTDPASLKDELPPGRDGSVFWSGQLPGGTSVMDTADRWARAAGRSTLEGRLHDLNVDAPWTDPTDAWWRTTSQMYATGSRGNAFFFGGLNQNPNSVWNTLELPALRNNSQVTCIYHVDPVTLTETLINGDPRNCTRPSTTNEPEWYVRTKEACAEWIASGPSHFNPPHVIDSIETNLVSCTFCSLHDELYGGTPEIPGPAQTFVYSLEPDHHLRNHSSSELQTFMDSHIRMFVTMEPTGIPRGEVVDGANHHLGYVALYGESTLFGTPNECVVIPEPGPSL